MRKPGARRIYALLVAVLLSPIALAQEQFGNAHYFEQVDPFSDENRSYVAIPAEESTAYDQVALFWRCREEAYELFVITDEYLDEGPVGVRFRFDQNDPSSLSSWYGSTNGTAAFARPTMADVFTDQALRSESVVVGLRDYENVEHVFNFTLNGVEDALRRLGCVLPRSDDAG